jgi:splicing factor 3B subunit 3
LQAIGCEDNTVRMLSLEPDTCLEPLGMQTIPSAPQSVSITMMKDVEGDRSDGGTMYLHIGQANGVLLRGNIDLVTGDLSQSRMRFIGKRQVGLFNVDIGGRGNALLVLTSRPWLAYIYKGKSMLVPISYEALDYGTGFSSEQCPQGIVSVSGNTLRIITLGKLGKVFNQGVVALDYTPRRITPNPGGKNFVVIESDHGILCESERKSLVCLSFSFTL